MFAILPMSNTAVMCVRVTNIHLCSCRRGGFKTAAPICAHLAAGSTDICEACVSHLLYGTSVATWMTPPILCQETTTNTISKMGPCTGAISRTPWRAQIVNRNVGPTLWSRTVRDQSAGPNFWTRFWYRRVGRDVRPFCRSLQAPASDDEHAFLWTNTV